MTGSGGSIQQKGEDMRRNDQMTMRKVPAKSVGGSQKSLTGSFCRMGGSMIFFLMAVLFIPLTVSVA
jgi:hypothetical protein